MTRDPIRLSALELAALRRSGALSRSEVTRRFGEHIARREPDLGALIELETLDSVDSPDGESGDAPLLGVPVLIKDNLARRGRPLSAGSRILEGYVSPLDATVVTRLRAAGAVPFGRARLDEFAMGSLGDFSDRMPVNPRFPELAPGGSSSGCAVGVAAGYAPLALGSDTGGSVRLPAAFCGVLGLRPTRGRLSRFGLVAHASSLDQVGLLARHPEDLAAAFLAVAGPDPRDSSSLDIPVAPGPLESLAELHGWTVLLPSGLDTSCESETRRTVMATARRLERRGARLERLDAGLFAHAEACYAILSMAEASTDLARYDGLHFGRRAAEREGDSAASLARRSRSEGFGVEVKRRLLLGAAVLSADARGGWYAKAQRLRRRIRAHLRAQLGPRRVLLQPVCPVAAVRRNAPLDPSARFRLDRFTVRASLAGLPAIAVPCGLKAAGHPAAVELVGAPLTELELLALARVVMDGSGAST